jgi:hypothetical protein
MGKLKKSAKILYIPICSFVKTLYISEYEYVNSSDIFQAIWMRLMELSF